MDKTPLTVRELAAKLGITRAAVYKAHETGRIKAAQDRPLRFAADTTLPAHSQRRVSDADRERIVALREKGHTQAQIAAAVDFTQMTICRVLKESQNIR